MSVRKSVYVVDTSIAAGSLETTINARIDQGYTFDKVAYDGTNYTLFFFKMNTFSP